MSLANSDFGDDAFGDALMETTGDDQSLVPEGSMAPPPPAYRKQGFSIYTVMLILSFVFLATAAIMFFIDAGKY